MPRKKLMVLVLVLVTLTCQLIYLGTLSIAIARANDTFTRYARAERIVRKSNEISKILYDASVAMGGYSLTKSPLFSDRYDKICRQLPESIADLRKDVGADTRQQQILANIDRICREGLKTLGESKGAIDDNQVDVKQFRARHMYKETRNSADRLQEEIHGLTEDEQKILNEPENRESVRRAIQYFLIAGLLMNILIAGIGLLVARKS